MSDTQRPDERVHIESKLLAPDGPVQAEIPPKVLALGEFKGDAETGYSTTRPIVVNRRNLANLAGQRPMLKDLEIQDHLTGQKGKKLIPQLVLSRTTDYWPAEIVAQVPELQALQTLLDALLEVKRNPRLRKELAEWLAADPEARAAFAQLANKTGDKVSI